DLADALRRALDDDGTGRDDASPRLRHLRRELRERRKRLVADLERLFQTPAAERIFAARLVTVGRGRYVGPVRGDGAARNRGGGRGEASTMDGRAASRCSSSPATRSTPTTTSCRPRAKRRSRSRGSWPR